MDTKEEHSKSDELELGVFRSVLTCAMEIASPKSNIKFQLQTNANKVVIATADMAADDAAVLAPGTASFIKVITDADSAEIVATVKCQGITHRFQSMAPTSKKFVSEACAVRFTEGKSASNCKMSY